MNIRPNIICQNQLFRANPINLFNSIANRLGHSPRKTIPTIYIDGSCQGPRHKRVAGYGVFWPMDEERNMCEPLRSEPQTNQRAELSAAIAGIEQAARYNCQDIIVCLDSHYVMKGALEWYPRWKQEGFTREVANIDLFERLAQAMKTVRVLFVYVPSEENRADPLAKAGARLDHQIEST